MVTDSAHEPEAVKTRAMYPRTLLLSSRQRRLVKQAALKLEISESAVIRKALEQFFTSTSDSSSLQPQIQAMQALLGQLMALEVGAWYGVSKGQNPEALIERGQAILAASSSIGNTP